MTPTRSAKSMMRSAGIDCCPDSIMHHWLRVMRSFFAAVSWVIPWANLNLRSRSAMSCLGLGRLSAAIRCLYRFTAQMSSFCDVAKFGRQNVQI